MEVADQMREEELTSLDQYRRGLEPAPVLYRPDGFKVTADNNDPMMFVASEESEDRMGDTITADGWELGNFKKNPVFLYMHDQSFPPLGMWRKVGVEGKQLLASPQWDDGDDFASLIKGKYVRGFMRAVSVGFRPIEFEEIKLKEPRKTVFGDRTTGLLFKKQELVEISAVAVPAHPKALRKALGARSYFWLPVMPEPAMLKNVIPEETESLPELDEALEIIRRIKEYKP